VQLQMNSAGDAFCAYEKRISSWGATPGGG
jgi:hypothetical protein